MEKKEYQKPKIEKIELAVEEAILAGCKTKFGAGPNASCQNVGEGAACRGNAQS
jgi:hypothetical protein